MFRLCSSKNSRRAKLRNFFEIYVQEYLLKTCCYAPAGQPLLNHRFVGGTMRVVAAQTRRPSSQSFDVAVVPDFAQNLPAVVPNLI